MVAVGLALLIQSTVAVAEPVLPAASWKVNSNDPLVEKTYWFSQPLFVIVIASKVPVSAATTS